MHQLKLNGIRVCVCVAIVLGFIVHSSFSYSFTDMPTYEDDILVEHYDALGSDFNFKGWD